MTMWTDFIHRLKKWSGSNLRSIDISLICMKDGRIDKRLKAGVLHGDLPALRRKN